MCVCHYDIDVRPQGTSTQAVNKLTLKEGREKATSQSSGPI